MGSNARVYTHAKERTHVKDPVVEGEGEGEGGRSHVDAEGEGGRSNADDEGEGGRSHADDEGEGGRSHADAEEEDGRSHADAEGEGGCSDAEGGSSHYDANASKHHIMYLDANNLYGWAMSEPLPHTDLSLEVVILEQQALAYQTVMALAADAPRGCFIEVDLGYPVELHDYHNDCPLAAERFVWMNMEIQALKNLTDSLCLT